MKYEQFIKWASEPKPTKIFKQNIEDFGVMIRTSGFKKYKKILEWRIHNVTEQSILKPKTGDYFRGYVEGMRVVLKDSKKLETMYEKYIKQLMKK